MYNLQHLKSLKVILTEKITTESNNRKVIDPSKTSNFFQTDLKSLNKDKYVIVSKVDNIFKFNEYKHIIDINRLIAEKESFGLCAELDDELNALIEFFNAQSDFKTKKGDKLLLLCPRSVSEYCPICSFINSLKSLKNIPSIYNSNKFINREDNDLIELTKYFNDIDRLIELLSSNIYVIEQYHLPCVIFDESSSEAVIHLMGIDKKSLGIISEQLSEELHILDMSIDEVENFTFRYVAEQTFVLESVNLSKFSDDFKEFINENIQKLSIMNKLTIENKLFAKKSEKIWQIQNDFERIFNRTAESLCVALEKISSMEGVI